ncbi:terminase small subunit [Sinorhizobium phage phiM9]|uniref:Putative terminase DNA packaging enzyme small subunit n=1 Tax=Sinorhizobium phage phiM9 TaxID=1636182 RepID=A0A0F6R4X4_9CAUD|nr:terminase small subunit [Sinorhizobium phage phiM9]AKE44707.1 putative terminase DNA packaging enzyme small subunit [Sinorhizobium phage phiM9]
MENENDLEFGNAGGSDLIDMLKSGVPSVIEDVETKSITIYVAPDETEEVKNAKDNIEFVVNSAREAVSFLLTLGKQTGNPRYFETVNSLLNTINGASGQLIGIDRKKKTPEPDKPDPANAGTFIQDNRQTFIGMSTAEALRMTAEPMKVIEG